MNIKRKLFIILLSSSFALTSFTASPLSYTIVDPIKIKAYMNQKILQIKQMAYKQMMSKINQELSFNLFENERLEATNNSQYKIVQKTQVATDIHNANMQMITSSDPRACGIVEASESFLSANEKAKQGSKAFGDRVIDNSNSGKLSVIMNASEHAKDSVKTSASFALDRPVSDKQAKTLISTLKPNLFSGSVKGSSKSRKVENLKREALESIVTAQMYDALTQKKVESKLSQPILSGFGGDPQDLTALLNANPKASTTPKDVYANLAIQKALQLNIQLKEYKAGIKKEFNAALKVQALQERLNK